MIKVFRYRLYPTRKQEKTLHDTCFLCSILYNQALQERKDTYAKTGVGVSVYDQSKALPALKKQDPRFKTAFSQVLMDVLGRLDKAYQNFFRRVKQGAGPQGYPKFKSARYYDSFTYIQYGFKIIAHTKNGRLKLSKIGTIKTKFHRPIEEEIKTLTIKRRNGKWFACFACEVQPKPLPKTGQVAGLDLGLEKYAVTSDGQFFDNPRFYRKSEKKLACLQREVSRKKKGSNRRKKAIARLGSLHEKVQNQRKDFLHKLTLTLLQQYDAIAIEDLKPNEMLSWPGINKSIYDASWSMFSSILWYKAEFLGHKVILVDPKNTSQQCCLCGNIVKKDLSIRVHDCPHCKLKVDRDLNAAINILHRSSLLGRNLFDQNTAGAAEINAQGDFGL